MPVKALFFKGDKKPKKRKHQPDTTTLSTQASAEDTEEDDTWTTPDIASDLSGPTLLVLPTIPVTCLACDAHGNVFASTIENILENKVETSEPHDIRQVWVVNRVAGTEEVSFKGSHGGYLSCDGMGVLGGRREARGLEEGFMVEAVEVKGGEGGEGIDVGEGRMRWRVRTAASKKGEGGARHLCAIMDVRGEEDEQKKKVSISLRGDGEAGHASTELVIKMQARFKPRLQQNKQSKANEKVSRKELEQVVGRKLEDDEVKRLKRARKNGTYHEEVLDVRVKGKHDKFA